MASGSHSKHKKKLSQKRSKKRTRSTKDKTKKRKRRHDSVSSSYEDSLSNSSVSSYSSRDDGKSKKRARSRDRKDSRKKAKRSRSVSESSRDDSPPVKKRKRSKKSKDSGSRKKQHGKKRRRSPSVSSSSRSLSDHSDNSDRVFERKEVKERKGRDKVKERSASKKREKDKARNVSKSRDRSKCGSPCSLHRDSHSYGGEDRVLVEENNPKRLKSVIVVAHENEEVEIRESNWVGNKAEIIFEKDEYPSRSNDSNDSNDGVCRREASSFSLDVSSGKPNKETLPSEVRTSEILESQSLVAEKTEQTQLNKFVSSGNDQIMKGDKIGVSTETPDPNSDNLATMLRLKALENFLKRKGKSLTNNPADKEDHNTKLNSSSSLKTNLTQSVSDVHSELKTVQNMGKVNEVNKSTDMPSLAKGKDASLPKRKFRISRLGEKYTAPSGFADSRPRPGLSTPRKEFIGARNTWRRQESSLPNVEKTLGKDSNQNLLSDASSKPNILTPEKPIDNDSKQWFTSKETSQPKLAVPKAALDLGSACPENSVCAEKVEGDAASQPSVILENSSNEKTNEGDGDSQFQQKTMSVMRGGEMVQVSYKVYIPNKAPALARRQLKR